MSKEVPNGFRGGRADVEGEMIKAQSNGNSVAWTSVVGVGKCPFRAHRGNPTSRQYSETLPEGKGRLKAELPLSSSAQTQSPSSD